jgi:hypothetical protein
MTKTDLNLEWTYKSSKIISHEQILELVKPSKFMGLSPNVPSQELLDDPEFQEDLEEWREQLNEEQLRVLLVWGSDDPVLLVGKSGRFYFETQGYIHELGKSVDDLKPYLNGSKKIYDAPRRY